jgi:hypothetical protein
MDLKLQRRRKKWILTFKPALVIWVVIVNEGGWSKEKLGMGRAVQGLEPQYP